MLVVCEPRLVLGTRYHILSVDFLSLSLFSSSRTHVFLLLYNLSHQILQSVYSQSFYLSHTPKVYVSPMSNVYSPTSCSSYPTSYEPVNPGPTRFCNVSCGSVVGRRVGWLHVSALCRECVASTVRGSGIKAKGAHFLLLLLFSSLKKKGVSPPPLSR